MEKDHFTAKMGNMTPKLQRHKTSRCIQLIAGCSGLKPTCAVIYRVDPVFNRIRPKHQMLVIFPLVWHC
jgi:hypothetical protein